MRAVHLTDLDAAVRYLLTFEEPEWPARAADLITRARVADKFRKRFHKSKVGYGTGTLASAVAGHAKLKASYCNAQYRRCLASLLIALDG